MKNKHTKYDIFISYRRDGGAQYARILQLMLQQRGYNVFLDYDELTDGKFGEHIKEALIEAPIFIIVLSKDALSRCKNDNDWVRQEILSAIQHHKHIIPINPEGKFNGIPQDIPILIRDELSAHQFSDIDFGQTLGVTVDFMINKRIVPLIGKRTPQSQDDSIINNGVQKLRKPRKIKLSLRKAYLYAAALLLLLLVFFGLYYMVTEINSGSKRDALIKQIESHHKGLNFMTNDSITIEQLQVIDEIFNNLRDIEGDSLRMSAFETTVRQYNVILGQDYNEDLSSMPVTEVSFGMVQQFIMALNELINAEATGISFSLPTEEEWEFAAADGRSANAYRFSGSNNADSVAWYINNSGGQIHPADGQNQLYPNSFGLYDMSGNVSEFVFTPYIDMSNPDKPTNAWIVKGGNYSSMIDDLETKSRTFINSDDVSDKIGFRLVLRKL